MIQRKTEEKLAAVFVLLVGRVRQYLLKLWINKVDMWRLQCVSRLIGNKWYGKIVALEIA